MNSIISLFKGDLIKKRGIDHFLDEIKGKIKLSEKEEVKIKAVYKLCQEKFFEIDRKNGEKYFVHLIDVAKIVMNFSNPTVNKIIIAILHDIIEDTDVTFGTLKNLFGPKIAIAVQILSKDNVDKHKNKKERNEVYFTKFTSIDYLIKEISLLCQEKWINLDKDDINKIAKYILDIKYADRIHNLQTQWDPKNIEKVKIKIKETKQYFLKSAEIYNEKAFNLLKKCIKKLENQLKENDIKKVKDTTKYNIFQSLSIL